MTDLQKKAQSLGVNPWIKGSSYLHNYDYWPQLKRDIEELIQDYDLKEEDISIEIVEEYGDLNVKAVWLESLTEEQLKELISRAEADQEKRERAEFEKLKAKFDKVTSDAN